jgi:hypothetical protein
MVLLESKIVLLAFHDLLRRHAFAEHPLAAGRYAHGREGPRATTAANRLSGLVERVTFHSADTGFCVLRVNVRGHRDLVTVSTPE